jgi:hypothetical protein
MSDEQIIKQSTYFIKHKKCPPVDCSVCIFDRCDFQSIDFMLMKANKLLREEKLKRINDMNANY